MEKPRHGTSFWRKLLYILSPQQKAYACVVLAFSLIGALFETLGVSIVYGIMLAMVSPEQLFAHRYLGPILRLFHVTSNMEAIWFTCLSAATLYIVKNLYLTFQTWLSVKYACKVRRELSVRIIQSFLRREYPFFLKTTTGELMQCTRADIDGIYIIVNQMINLFIDALTTIFIFAYIIYTDTMMALAVIILGILCMLIVTLIFRKRTRLMGQKSRESKAVLNQYMLQAYNGIKEIMVKRLQPFFVHCYEREYLVYQKTQVVSQIVNASPSRIIEAVSISGIMIALAIRMSSIEDAATFVPKLATFAMAGFRIMPNMGRISAALNTLTYRSASLTKTWQTLRDVETEERMRREAVPVEESEADRQLRFREVLELTDITWHYEGVETDVLKHLQLRIEKGHSVGIMGASGAGKTTLMDVILGLLMPQQGQILVDGRDVHEIPTAWAHMIGYVPQTIYMTNDTVRNNVAFGVSEKKIDDEAVWHALKEAQIDDFVKQLPDGLDTKVGERGVRISGGQRQRIAIARALYYDPDILVFDEATSALDNETEAAVMESINALQHSKTLIIVAHRLSTLSDCDEIYEICDGVAVKRDKSDLGSN